MNRKTFLLTLLAPFFPGLKKYLPSKSRIISAPISQYSSYITVKDLRMAREMLSHSFVYKHSGKVPYVKVGDLVDRLTKGI